ncbi:MAG: hypothetical protein ACXWD4_12685, partial [Bacteroidia bacterium]
FREIEWNDVYIDIHDDFDFIGINKDNENQVTLKFTKTTGSWVGIYEFSELEFIHKHVSYIYKEVGEVGASDNDKKILGEITFFPSSSREINTSLTSQEIPNKEDDIIYFFEDGKVMRIGCEEIEVVVR